jgi:hypothetical protein
MTPEELVRERLTDAGLIAETGQPRTRPDADEVAEAGAAAAVGVSAAEFISADRG